MDRGQGIMQIKIIKNSVHPTTVINSNGVKVPLEYGQVLDVNEHTGEKLCNIGLAKSLDFPSQNKMVEPGSFNRK